MSVLKARAGRATFIEILGMLAGLTMPAVLVGWIVFAAGRFSESEDASYSHVEQTISELGDANLAHTTWYEWANGVLAVLLLLFTYSVLRRAPIGRMTVVFLLLAAAATMFIAFVPCDDGCSVSGGWQNRAHALLAGATALLILLIPWAASRKTTDTERYQIVKRASRFLFEFGVAAALLLVTLAALNGRTETELPVGLAERALWGSGYAWIVLVSAVMLLDWRGRVRKRLDVTRLQENVVYGHQRTRHGHLAVATIDDAPAFRRWLAAALENQVIQRELRRPRPRNRPERDFAVTVGLTRRGVARLGIEYESATAGDDPFHDGMQARQLGDNVDTWEERWKRPERHHVAVWITAHNRDALRRAMTAIDLDALNPHVSQDMAVGDDSREPFGFVDGISNPWLEDVHPTDDPARFGGGKLARGKKGEFGWAPLAIGEFILGEFDEGGDQSPAPKPAWLFGGATFLVARKLLQHVEAFDTWAEDVGNRNQQDPASIKAQLVGRTRDGDPLADRSGTQYSNDFLYGDDPEGFKCPMAAHVRRANPRDTLGFDGVPAHRRRIIRRGLPFHDGRGSGTDGGGDGGGIDGGGDGQRGLMFMGLNARLAGQFEFIQRFWLNDGTAFRVSTNPDPIGGQWNGPRDVLITDRETPVLEASEPFVESLGGEYFVIPPFDALERISTS